MDDSLNKKYYRIREVSDIVGVNCSTLRFWETQFPQLEPRRNSHGTRYYTPADLETVRIIHYLIKTKGLKIEAAREELRVNRAGVSRNHEIIDRLTAVRDSLNTLIDSLHSMR
ncbi:MAG: MerR family transcriptional regulator [Bacteroides sp.]|nr:MerR family transcriptional regulator [Bacteroidales bacterium]MBD5250437.1 MerR family transcriptional regulator [Barnesiella sp.]MBD5345022.1 MerR family transcriptional regulator [Bacteroides sp.]MBD5369088.1 MerR family transcriptional regulator [Bacteroides sp.]MDE5828455.1 MerR family transcriptional regulator [Duncaniella sp.]